MTNIPTWHERAEAHPDHQSGMISEDMIRARMGEEISDLRAEIERTYALLKDPNVVSINMLRGVIAMPSVEQIRHIYQDRLLLPDLATVVKERDEARGGGGAAARGAARGYAGGTWLRAMSRRDRPHLSQRTGDQTMKTTLNKIRAHHPCKDGWEKLLRHLNKTQPDDEPLLLETILDANGLGDALWCLRAVDGHDREIRLYLVWCVRQVQHMTTDPRSGAALDVAERYARGQASREELEAASAAAAAAWAAAKARAAAWVAASAARAASAAPAAAAAAWEAAWEATAAARQAAWAERAAAAAWEAAEAATRAAIDAQVIEFRRVCREIAAGRDPYPMGDKP